VVLQDDHRVAFLSGPGRRLLAAATGTDVEEGDVLPAPLPAWLREGADVPLVLGGGRPLVARHLAGRDGGPDVLFLQPGLRTVTATALRELGLTDREAEVLHLIVLGRRSEDVAAELRISPRTVHKHVEHIFAKLGVGSRVEAVATVWAAVGLEASR
jgi:DNA-binding CsgD family transcriptional regulator